MRPRVLLVLLVLLVPLAVGACDRPAPIPDVDLALRVSTSTRETELGKAFPLEIVRVWSKRLDPEAFDEAVLSPLVVRLETTDRRENATHVEEIRRYRAYAFAAKDVVVPAASFHAAPKGGGEARVAKSEPLHLHVLPAIDPRTPGPVELPDGPLPERSPVVPVAVALGVLATFVLARALARRRRVPSPVVAPVPRTPADRALDALARLEADGVASEAARLAVASGVAGVLRDYLAEHLDLPAWVRTREEILARAASTPGVTPAVLHELASPLETAELAKFARHVPTAGEIPDALGHARAFVRATAARRASS